MCYEYRRLGRKEKDEERARREAEAAIEKARSEGGPEPEAAEERPATAEEPTAS